MINLKRFFIGISALIIISFFAFRYWQTQPSYSLLQIQESIDTKNSDLFYKHVDIENILAEFYEDLYELFEEYFSDNFDANQAFESFNAEVMAENSFSYIKPEIESAIEQGLESVWNESNREITSSEFYTEEYTEIANNMLSTAELAYINKEGNKAYLGISMYEAKSEQEYITEFELTKVENYWKVTKWSNFKELTKEAINEAIESFNDISEEINDSLFDTQELEKELEELEKELQDLFNLYND